MIDKKTIRELQEIFKDDYKKNITFSEATKIAEAFVEVYSLLAEINYQKNNED